MNRQGQAGEGEKRATKCWGCQEEGHVVRDCPSAAGGPAGGQPLLGAEAGEQGRLARRQPQGRRRRHEGTSNSQGNAAPPARGKSGRGRGGRGRGRKLAAMSGDGDDDTPEAEEEPAGNEEGSAL
jgi:hypothetical protein